MIFHLFLPFKNICSTEGRKWELSCLVMLLGVMQGRQYDDILEVEGIFQIQVDFSVR